MLKELLPKLQNQLTKSKSQQQKNQVPKNPTINLIEDPLTLYDQDTYLGRTNFARKVIWSCAFLFTIVLGINFFLDTQLLQLKETQDDLIRSVTFRASTETEFNELKRNVEFYTAAKSKRQLLGEKVKLVYAFTQTPVEMNRVLITPDRFLLDGTGANALDFNALIRFYITQPLVKEILLRNAELNDQSKSYSVVLEGNF